MLSLVRYLPRANDVIGEFTYAIMCVLAGVGSGFAVTHAGTTGEYVVVSVAACAIVIGAVRLLTRRQTVLGGGGEPPDSVGDPRGPRRLFYLGVMSVCWLRLRIHGVTVSDALFLAALTWMVADELVRHRQMGRVLPQGVRIGIFLFSAGAVLSTVANSADVLGSLAVVARVFYLVAAWFWLGGRCLRSPEHVWRALKLWIVSAAVCGGWAIGQKYAHLPGGVEQGRYTGLADHVNDLGALTACALVPAIALASRANRWAVAVLGLMGGLVVSASVGAAAAAVAAVIAGLAAKELLKPLAVAVVVGVVAFAVLSPTLGVTPASRLSVTTSSYAPYGQNTLATRFRTYATAWRRIEDDPLFGTGFDSASSTVFDPVTNTSYQVHNLFLGVAFEGGLIALAGLVGVLLSIARACWRLAAAGTDRYLALVLLPAFVAYLGDEMSEPSLYKRYSLIPALLIISLYAQASRSTSAGIDAASSEDMLVAEPLAMARGR